MLTKKEVEKIAELAKIELKQEEVEKFRTELSAILDFVGQLSSVKSVASQTEEKSSFLRTDEATDTDFEKSRLLQSPTTGEGFLKVPKVFKTQ